MANLNAVEAKFEAQKIAFAPLAFQAAYALRELGILEVIGKAGKNGVSVEKIAEQCGLSHYGVRVLAEIGAGMGILKNAEHGYAIDKTGYFILQDDMTRVNMNFVQDVCYNGAKFLTESVKNSKPEGLRVFGQWNTIYEALSKLPPQVQKSWFEFDHFYSDIAFPEALPIVFRQKRNKLMDIGGNTAKWALACCKYSPDVNVAIVDLPGQTEMAKGNIEKAGFANRISTFASNILQKDSPLPQDADAVWMSQFLDCFSLEQITSIIAKIVKYTPAADIFVLEPLWDMQRFEASSYSLQATSLYFTCMANGNSKMYGFKELVNAVEKAGVRLIEANHNLGANSYSLLLFRK
ncbi:MAG: SAM-dependent methyltransferase [Candidatus Fibromonas sp.]|jgi:hypothetical protein|nr:SAM-dependent methyltransferase [Candidatus Fibromonas sp.]